MLQDLSRWDIGGAFLRAVRRGFRSPRRFNGLLVVVEGLDQASEHFCRSFKQCLGLRLRYLANVVAQMIDELAHLSFDFFRVVYGVIRSSHNDFWFTIFRFRLRGGKKCALAPTSGAAI